MTLPSPRANPLVASLPTFLSALACLFTVTPSLAAPGTTEEQITRGRALYFQHCIICHQSAGQGVPGSYPPLAESDFVRTNGDRAIRTIVEGMSGPIVVNGKAYNGVMPPVVLDDAKVADVMTFLLHAFKNGGGQITAEKVKAIRAKSRFATYEALVAASAYPPLPAAPAGFTLQETARLTAPVTRLTSDGRGKSLYLAGGTTVSKLDLLTKKVTPLIALENLGLDIKRGDIGIGGFALDAQKRLYLVVSQRVAPEGKFIVTNEITFYRTSATNKEGDPIEPRVWFRTSYPWGIGPYNHGVGNLAFGPDGFLYVSSGSRTDGNETGTDPVHFATIGETPLTACLWRLDPKSDAPEIKVYSAGHRNAYGFCWNDRGELFATDNGPDADAPEELNRVIPGKHYGFPYRFSDWSKKAYPYTPDAPAGLDFALPVANRGPAAGGSTATPMATFDPHSSPAGIVHLGNDFPGAFRDSLLVVRFGNLLQQKKDVGFDLLRVRTEPTADGGLAAEVTTVLAPLGRPLDVHVSGKGRVFILEYTRSIDNSRNSGWLPGRILELAVKK